MLGRRSILLSTAKLLARQMEKQAYVEPLQVSCVYVQVCVCVYVCMWENGCSGKVSVSAESGNPNRNSIKQFIVSDIVIWVKKKNIYIILAWFPINNLVFILVFLPLNAVPVSSTLHIPPTSQTYTDRHINLFNIKIVKEFEQ